MTVSAHVAGPWRYHYEPTLGRHVVRAGFGGERNICVEYGAGLTTYEAAANARLISAAPDLLEAAQEALRFITDIDNSHASVPLLRAAIAKATKGDHE